MGRLRTASDIWHPPIRSLRGLSRGMSRLYGLVKTEVADDMIDLDDDVLKINIAIFFEIWNKITNFAAKL